MEVDLLGRRYRAVGSDQVWLEAGDVAVLHRLLGPYRLDEDVVLARLHEDRAECVANPLAVARIAGVVGPLPSFRDVETLLIFVVPLELAGARVQVDSRLRRIGRSGLAGGRSAGLQHD